jgi:hypothetical protein
MMCWGEPSVKVIGDEPKYVALARLGKSFFFTKQGSNLRRPSYYPTAIAMHKCTCRVGGGSGEMQA